MDLRREVYRWAFLMERNGDVLEEDVVEAPPTCHHSLCFHFEEIVVSINVYALTQHRIRVSFVDREFLVSLTHAWNETWIRTKPEVDVQRRSSELRLKFM
jgi:hypothetical protein